MTDVREAWTEVGDAFESLGLKLRLHFEESSGETSDAVLETVRVFADTVRSAAKSLADTAADPALRADAQRIGRAVASAVSATVGEVGESVRPSS
jgi:hypothetical protein